MPSLALFVSLIWEPMKKLRFHLLNKKIVHKTSNIGSSSIQERKEMMTMMKLLIQLFSLFISIKTNKSSLIHTLLL